MVYPGKTETHAHVESKGETFLPSASYYMGSFRRRKVKMCGSQAVMASQACTLPKMVRRGHAYYWRAWGVGDRWVENNQVWDPGQWDVNNRDIIRDLEKTLRTSEMTNSNAYEGWVCNVEEPSGFLFLSPSGTLRLLCEEALRSLLQDERS